MDFENLYIRATRYSQQASTEINLADALKLLGILDVDNISHFDLVVKDKNGCEISAYVDGEGIFSDKIIVEGVNETGKGTGLACVSLPDKYCPYIATSVLCGDGDTEDLDRPVIVRVVDCVRIGGDKSRRVAYYDKDVVCAIGFDGKESNYTNLNAATEDEHVRTKG